jgi:hypothetical protein
MNLEEYEGLEIEFEGENTIYPKNNNPKVQENKSKQQAKSIETDKLDRHKKKSNSIFWKKRKRTKVIITINRENEDSNEFINSKTEAQKEELFKEIEKNIQKRIEEEEKQIRKQQEEQKRRQQEEQERKEKEELKRKELEEQKKKEREKLKNKENRKKQANAKKKIKRAKRRKNTRLTCPKENRSLINRFHHLIKYDMGDYEFIESDIKEGKVYPSDFQEIQDYEDVIDDVALRRGWNGFKMALTVALLSASIALGNYTVNECKNTINQINQKKIETLAEKPKPTEAKAKYYFLKFQDQEYLSEIAEVEETDTNEEKYEKMKSTYDELPDEIKQYMRDPERILEIKKQKEEKNNAKSDVEDSKINEDSSQNNSDLERE